MNIELKERSREDLLDIISAKDMKIVMQNIEIERLHSIIKEVREEMENAKHISVSDEYHIIEHEKKLLEILEKENIWQKSNL